MIFSTKMKSSGELNNMHQNNGQVNIPSSIFFSISMFDKLKASVECNDCKKAKFNIIK